MSQSVRPVQDMLDMHCFVDTQHNCGEKPSWISHLFLRVKSENQVSENTHRNRAGKYKKYN